MEGQVITVPTGIEAPTLCTMTFVGSKLVLSAASTGLEKTSDAKRRKRKRRKSRFFVVLPHTEFTAAILLVIEIIFLDNGYTTLTQAPLRQFCSHQVTSG